MLFFNNNTQYFIQRVKGNLSEDKPDKLVIFHKYTVGVEQQDVNKWIKKVKTYSRNTDYDKCKSSSLRFLKLNYNKNLSISKDKIVKTDLDFYAIYNLNSQYDEKALVEIRGDKDLVFPVLKFAKEKSIQYVVYNHKYNKMTLILKVKEENRADLAEISLQLRLGSEHSNLIIDKF